MTADSSRGSPSWSGSDRFVRAAERIIGRDLSTVGEDIKVRLDEPLAYGESAAARVAMTKVLRDLAGATLRGATELDSPMSLHWIAINGAPTEIEVQAGTYRIFHLVRALNLTGETIVQIRQYGFAHQEYAPTNFDPARTEIGRRRAAVI